MKPVSKDSFIGSWSKSNGIEVKDDKVQLTDEQLKKFVEVIASRYANIFDKEGQASLQEGEAYLLVKSKSDRRSG